MQTTQDSTPRQPVYIYVNGKPVYRIHGTTLHKTVKSNHFLTQPPGLAISDDVIAQAVDIGITDLEFRHKETGDVYRCKLEFMRRWGQHRQHTGYDGQQQLPLEYWSVNGDPPKRRPVAVVQAERDAARANMPRQMPLFGGAV